MASEVTVDAKPMPQLPYDPDTIPPAVKARAAAVDAMYSKSVGPEHPPAEEAKPPEQLSLPLAEASVPQTPDTNTPPTPRPAAADHVSPSDKEENLEVWKSRYFGLQGRYTAAQKTIGEMQEQMNQLGGEFMQLQRTVSQQQRPAPPPPAWLTEKDVQDYGSDLINVTQRAALQAVSPHFQQIEAQNQELQRRLEEEARARLDMRVEAAVPNYRDIDQNPRWLQWLRGIDVLSGRVRQQLLNEAIASAQAPRVISFFRGFQQEEAATGHSEPAPSSRQEVPVREPALNLESLAAPGRARPAGGGEPSLPSDRPIYTRPQIAQLYAAHRRGAYVGREAEWQRQDLDIIAAGREGRIRT